MRRLCSIGLPVLGTSIDSRTRHTLIASTQQLCKQLVSPTTNIDPKMAQAMIPPYFDKNDIPPTEPKLKEALGAHYSAYKEILDLTDAFDHEWKYYGAKIGWQLKATRKGKALFYLTPHEQSFRIGFAVRENERKRLLDSNLFPESKCQLASAKKYPEGYPLRLEVRNKANMKDVRTVIAVLKESR